MNFNTPLLTPYNCGRIKTANRVVMAPLTRRRATDGHIPTELMKEYYCQRAGAGLIIAEATNISRQGTGYMNSPGIYSNEQIEKWSEITAAVHGLNGRMFLQLWHTGRVSHMLLQPEGQLPVSASAIRAEGYISTPKGRRKMPVPRSLTEPQIISVIGDYVEASCNAVKAGFDGVEIHAANGYLPDQFLHSSSNYRTDRYGGSIENRARFLLEVTGAVSEAIGSERVGVRLSPGGINKDMYDPEPVPLFTYVVERLNDFSLSYLHLQEPLQPLEPVGRYRNYLQHVTPFFRKIYNGTLITCGGYDFESGNRVISEGIADLVAYGKLFISNPDLVERFRNNAPMASWNKSTFYKGGALGYTDYPFWKR